jgi:hypothetical protein
MNKKIAIIGSGWFGLHIGKVLKSYGYDIAIYDKSSNIFSGSSSKNQFRIHRGFHYPRNHKTRKNIGANFKKFIDEYSSVVEDVENNIYCVVEGLSIIDAGTYGSIFLQEGVPFNPKDSARPYPIKNVERCFQCDEKAINTTKAIEFFEQIFEQKEFRLSTEVKSVKNTQDQKVLVNEDEYDACINCTYNYLNPIKNLNCKYQACLTLIYRCINSSLRGSALTLVDGEFFSIYPIVDSKPNYTVTHVKYTPLNEFESSSECLEYMNNLKDEDAYEQRELVEKDIFNYYNNFANDFVYQDYFISNKTMVLSNSANRTAQIGREGNILNVFSGKIQEIFEVEKYIKLWLEIV